MKKTMSILSYIKKKKSNIWSTKKNIKTIFFGNAIFLYLFLIYKKV